jgi:hypothetical protein
MMFIGISCAIHTSFHVQDGGCFVLCRFAAWPFCLQLAVYVYFKKEKAKNHGM